MTLNPTYQAPTSENPVETNGATRKPYFERDRLRTAVQEAYTEVAEKPENDFHFICGAPLADRLGYTQDHLEGVPSGAIDSFAGVGNPFRIEPIKSGERVVDLGAGAGTDSIIAARRVGPHGSVVGIDMTEAMLDRARSNAAEAGRTNVRFEKAFIESLPFEENSVDVVISNGVINLCPEKDEVFEEILRILEPGGRFQIADVLVDKPVPAHVSDLIYLWTDCVAGGTPMLPYVAMIQRTGFEEVEITEAFDAFGGAAVQVRADRYGARGYNIRGRKPLRS